MVCASPRLRAAGVKLVIAGDFIGFLVDGPGDPWTLSEDVAVAKLETLFACSVKLFDAFAGCALGPARGSVLLGKHDVELAYRRA